jgi:hypothetical protein
VTTEHSAHRRRGASIVTVDGMLWLVVVCTFVLSRWAYYRAGVRFNSDPVYYFTQLLDPYLLSHRLLESAFYLHAQPPLFNVLTGLALKLGGEHVDLLLCALYLCVAFAVLVLFIRTLTRLAVPTWMSMAVATAFCCAPPFVLYENWYFYPLLELLALQVAAYALLRSEGRPGRWMATALWTLAALVWFRSLYHPVYFLLAVAAVVGLAATGDRRAVLVKAIGPGIAVALLVLKNVALFGLWGTSSWGPNSLHKVIEPFVEKPALQAMVQDGELTPISAVWEFSPGGVYIDLLRLPDERHGVPALDELRKGDSDPRIRRNPVNYNHWSYLHAAKAYMHDTRILIRRFPEAYLDAVRWNARHFVRPVTAHGFLAGNRSFVPRVTAVFDCVELALLSLVPILLVVSAVSLLKRKTPRAERLILAFMLGTLSWATVLSLLAEHGENNRFRFHLMGLVVLLACYCARVLVEGLRMRYAARVGVRPYGV